MKNNRISGWLWGLVLSTVVLVSGCNESPVPKPRAFFRIHLPEKTYHSPDSGYPYLFEIPGNALLIPDQGKDAEPYWAHLDYPEFNARIHLSYKKIDGNLAQYIDDSHKMAMKHIARSSGIREHVYEHPERRVFGTLYDIRGTAAASPLQFYVTDSTRHFLRGALYFNLVPNNDSLAPVISYIEEDIRHLLETLHWKQN